MPTCHLSREKEVETRRYTSSQRIEHFFKIQDIFFRFDLSCCSASHFRNTHTSRLESTCLLSPDLRRCSMSVRISTHGFCGRKLSTKPPAGTSILFGFTDSTQSEGVESKRILRITGLHHPRSTLSAGVSPKRSKTQGSRGPNRRYTTGRLSSDSVGLVLSMSS